MYVTDNINYAWGIDTVRTRQRLLLHLLVAVGRGSQLLEAASLPWFVSSPFASLMPVVEGRVLFMLRFTLTSPSPPLSSAFLFGGISLLIPPGEISLLYRAQVMIWGSLG